MSIKGAHFTSEKGQTAAEYAVILAVITLAIVTTFSLLAGAVEEALLRVLDVVGGIV
jgi:Flp pilus assembly pilin Flp